MTVNGLVLTAETRRMIEDELVENSGIMLSREEQIYRRAIKDFFKMVDTNKTTVEIVEE